MLRLSESDDRRTEINASIQTAIACFELSLPGATEYLTVNPHDIMVGTQSYTSSDSIVNVSVPAPQQSLSRDLFTIDFESTNKTESGYRHKFVSSGWTGIALTVRIVFQKSDGTRTEPLVAYKGRCLSVTDNVTDSGAILSVTFVGKLSTLQSSRVNLTTPDNQKRRDATDTCFDFVHDTFNLKWGSTKVVESGGGYYERGGGAERHR